MKINLEIANRKSYVQFPGHKGVNSSPPRSALPLGYAKNLGGEEKGDFIS
jgi:hypothetical protein